MLIPFDNSYARLPDAFFVPVNPTPVTAPAMIRLNHALATELGIDVSRLDSPEGLAILSRNEGDFEPFHRLHEVLRNPFAEQP